MNVDLLSEIGHSILVLCCGVYIGMRKKSIMFKITIEVITHKNGCPEGQFLSVCVEMTPRRLVG